MARTVIAVALIALAVGVGLSKPPFTAAPPADKVLRPSSVPQNTPTAAISVLGKKVRSDRIQRKEGAAEIEVAAVVATHPKIIEPASAPAAIELAPATVCPRQYYQCRRGLFRRR